jgi:hypothetical protein
MNEAETRAGHIDPALNAAGWQVVEGSRIRREYPNGEAVPASRGLQLADDVRGKLLAHMRRNTRFEAGSFPFVIALDHLSHLMEPRDDARLVVWHGQLDEIAQGPQLSAQLL